VLISPYSNNALTMKHKLFFKDPVHATL